MKNTATLFLVFISSLLIFNGCNSPDNVETAKEMTIAERIQSERTDDEAVEQKIDELIDKMSVTEKVGQMTQVNEAFFGVSSEDAAGTGAQAKVLDSVKVVNTIREFQIGSFLAGGERTPEKWMAIVKKLQEINMAESESEIPIIFAVDHVHGSNYLSNGTIFPHEINLGATFQPQFSYDMGYVTAREIAHLGHHWNFAPILDIGQEKLWPRIYETFGEDTHVAAVMGAEYIKGLQETTVGPYRVAGCAKHYLGYSIPGDGWDRSPVEISPQTLQEIFVPSFEAAFDAGAMTAMINSGEINGVPVHASYYYLTTMLRDQLGFEGVAITDYLDIIKLHTEHFVTENEKESTYKAIMAGVDMSMTPTTTDFCVHLRELVEEGRIPEERLDLSVRRILRLKFQLGLFDTPYPTDEYLDLVGSEEHHAQAKAAAEESIVLMKNDEGLLPLSSPNKIVLAGPNANLRNVLAGGWTYSWQGNDESMYLEEMKTLFQGMQEEFGSGNVVLAVKGQLKTAATGADAIVLAIGEKPYAEGWGNIDDLDLPIEQAELIDEAAATGKPVVLVFIEGRPRTIGQRFDDCQAALFAGLPGMFGAEAIAGVLSGRINPSGKMSMTYPYKSGHVIPYNYKHMVFSYLNVYNPDIQQYTIGEFGTGMSYTTFEYSDLQLSSETVARGNPIKATVTVTNTGEIAGKEAILWFLTDEVASVTRPVRQLKHFEKEEIAAGESKTFTFEIHPMMHLSYPNAQGEEQLENGFFKLTVGDLEKQFELK